MTTAIPAEAFDHGDARRYRRGCRCRPCTRAASIASRNHQYLRDTGRGALVPPNRAANHIRILRAAGAPDHEIKAAANVCNEVFYRIIRGEGRIHRDTAQRILAVPVPALPGPGNGQDIDGTGTYRRLQALIAAGWPGSYLGERLGKDKRYVAQLLAQRSARVRAWVADRVRRLYMELQDQRPEDHGVPQTSVLRARLRAQRKGWVGPEYWDPDTIDDSLFRPAVSDDIGRQAEARLIAEEIRHLASCGVSAHEIACRVGRTESYVRSQLAGGRAPGWRAEKRRQERGVAA